MFLVLLLLLLVGFVLMHFLDPLIRKDRIYRALLAQRTPVSDEDLHRLHFIEEQVDPELPGRVRAAIARSLDYPAEKILPDDDLSFWFAELDMADVLWDVEKHYGLNLTSEDYTQHLQVAEERTGKKLNNTELALLFGTFRTLAEIVSNKIRQSRCASAESHPIRDL